jgi:hypothetical protein
MATTTITPRSALLPDGTDVALFKRTDVDVQRRTDLPPLGTAVATGEISEGKFTTEAALTADTDYVLFGRVDKVDATAGQFKLTFEGQQTGNIAFNATAAAVREALEALSNVAVGDVAVTGGPGDSGGTKPYVVTFRLVWGGLNVGAMTGANGTTPLSGGGAAITISTTTQGSQAGAEGVQRYVMYRTPPA